MYWLMICRHKPGTLDLRERNRDAHRQHIASGGGGAVRVLIGSALTADDGETPCGNFGLLEAPTRDAALDFARNDPFALAGIVDSIDVTALATRFQADRIRPMSG